MGPFVVVFVDLGVYLLDDVGQLLIEVALSKIHFEKHGLDIIMN